MLKQVSLWCFLAAVRLAGARSTLATAVLAAKARTAVGAAQALLAASFRVFDSCTSSGEERDREGYGGRRREDKEAWSRSTTKDSRCARYLSCLTRARERVTAWLLLWFACNR